MKQTRTEGTYLVTQQIVGDLGAEAKLLLNPAFYGLDKCVCPSICLLDKPNPQDFPVKKAY